MEFLYPWGNYLKKSGGTIAGNLIVNGNLNVLGQTTLEDTLVIEHDSAGFGDPHIQLKPETAGGVFTPISFTNLADVVRSGIAGDMLGNLSINPLTGMVVYIPGNYLGANPLLQFPTLAVGMEPMRINFLHSVMMGI